MACMYCDIMVNKFISLVAAQYVATSDIVYVRGL